MTMFQWCSSSILKYSLWLTDVLSFRSTVKANCLTPEWNEFWRIKNVPVTAELYVEILDKDPDTPHDDYIGKFKSSVDPGERDFDIQGPLFRRNRGTFRLEVRLIFLYSPFDSVVPCN